MQIVIKEGILQERRAYSKAAEEDPWEQIFTIDDYIPLYPSRSTPVFKTPAVVGYSANLSLSLISACLHSFLVQTELRGIRVLCLYWDGHTVIEG